MEDIVEDQGNDTVVLEDGPVNEMEVREEERSAMEADAPQVTPEVLENMVLELGPVNGTEVREEELNAQQEVEMVLGNTVPDAWVRVGTAINGLVTGARGPPRRRWTAAQRLRQDIALVDIGNRVIQTMRAMTRMYQRCGLGLGSKECKEGSPIKQLQRLQELRDGVGPVGERRDVDRLEGTVAPLPAT